MDWRTENSKDTQLLDRLRLVALDSGMAAGDVDLLAMIEGHNDRAALAMARLRILAAERQYLADFDAWRERDAAALMAERARLRGETWEVLRELRHVLEEREDVLGQIEQRLLEQYQDAGQEYDRAVATAERSLAKEHRVLQKVNPAAAGSHFAELVADDESVRQATREQAVAQEAFAGIVAARRSIVIALSDITARQREVFAALAT